MTLKTLRKECSGSPRREWHLLTSTELDALDRERTVVWVSASPLEVHGPHLPLGTDFLEAEVLGDRGLALLSARHPELEFVHLPPIYVAADVVPRPGSIRFRSSTITRVMEDLGRSLARQGFKNIWVFSFHGGPRHFVPIEIAADRVNQKYGARMVSAFSLMLSRLTGGSSDLADLLAPVTGLTPEALRGDSHAGAIETSIMLHSLGDYVDDGFAALGRRTVTQKMRDNGHAPFPEDRRPTLIELLRSLLFKLKYFEDETYAGDPALATAERGDAILDELARLSADVLDELVTGRLSPEDCHSPLWPVRSLVSNETLSWLLERAVRYRDRVF
jgi:creatinine amidohydrolase